MKKLRITESVCFLAGVAVNHDKTLSSSSPLLLTGQNDPTPIWALQSHRKWDSRFLIASNVFFATPTRMLFARPLRCATLYRNVNQGWRRMNNGFCKASWDCSFRNARWLHSCRNVKWQRRWLLSLLSWMLQTYDPRVNVILWSGLRFTTEGWKADETKKWSDSLIWYPGTILRARVQVPPA